MFRTFLSIVALSTLSGLLIVQPGLATAQQTKAGGRAAAKAAPTAPGSLVNINTASASALEGLPGIGAKTAARIVEYRQKNGPFKKIEELMNVRGVGEKNFLKLKPHLTVSEAKSERVAAQQ